MSKPMVGFWHGRTLRHEYYREVVYQHNYPLIKDACVLLQDGIVATIVYEIWEEIREYDIKLWRDNEKSFNFNGAAWR